MTVFSVSASAAVWLTDVFLIASGQQWSSMLQTNKLNHVTVIRCTCWFGLFTGFVDSNDIEELSFKPL